MPLKSDHETRRRLAAILMADVAGYSRLMESDEAGTLAALKDRRKTVLEPLLKMHGGRIVKVMGDGLLVEFASAIKAVEAACEIQDGMGKANDGVPDERAILLRIGINLGDVIGDGDDIYGEGVNIASRLETLAPRGGICISAKIYDEVRGKVRAAFEDVGERQLKNIARPVHAYVIHIAAEAETGSRPVLLQSDKPSIAVLAFADFGKHPDESILAKGVAEDIVTELSRYKQLRVLSFLHQPNTRIESARYRLEGTIRKASGRIRVTAQLIDGEAGNTLWAEKYDRGEDELFDIQDELVRTIVTTLISRINADQVDAARRKPPSNLTAYECVLMADAISFRNPTSNERARELCRQAIALDPSYVRAYTLLGALHYRRWVDHLDTPDSEIETALELANKALALDPVDANLHHLLSQIHLWRRNYERARHHCDRALAINPNRPSHHTSLANLALYEGRTAEALALYRKARDFDPNFEPDWYWSMIGIARYVGQDYGDALLAFSRVPDQRDWVEAYIAAAHAQLGDDNEARLHAALVLKLNPGFSIEALLTRDPFRYPADRQHTIDGMKKAGLA